MSVQRAHILLPEDLIAEIDALVGPRGRSAFLAETARAELRRRNLLSVLESPEPAWKDENHPELAQGTAAWVHQQREREERDDGQSRVAEKE
jgi:metal-responsive CopG/Arc/MetJ family transcriptional regulator